MYKAKTKGKLMAVLSHGGGRENSQEFLITIILFSPPSADRE